ncbi:MAG TPA: PfkB family carbohydrate kinase [Acidimicrobiales bacterium]|nr:PfkB family carbohydrate kinase [Acidimicrobiales bacterium]
MSARRVLVLGDVMLDVVVRPHGSIAPTSDTASEIRVVRGGSSATLAVALARRGHEVTFVGACGDDLAADLVERSLEDAGVTARLQRVDASTGVVVALISEEGERAMMSDRGANRFLEREFVVDAFESSEHLHVSGYVILDGETRNVGATALAEARARAMSTSVDVCSVAPLRVLGSSRFLEATLDAQSIFANEEEALALAESSDLDGAVDFLAHRYDEVLVTRGPEGAWSHVEGHRHWVQAREVEVRDTTGAGDASTGAYLGARLEGASVVEAMQAAMDAGARAVSELGAPS